MKPNANNEKDHVVKVGDEVEVSKASTVVSFVPEIVESTKALPTIDYGTVVRQNVVGPAWSAHYAFSLLTSLCCFGPCSVIGLVHFLAAKTEYNKGNVHEALKRKRQAKAWSAASLAVGVIAVVTVIIFIMVCAAYSRQAMYKRTSEEVPKAKAQHNIGSQPQGDHQKPATFAKASTSLKQRDHQAGKHPVHNSTKRQEHLSSVKHNEKHHKHPDHQNRNHADRSRKHPNHHGMNHLDQHSGKHSNHHGMNHPDHHGIKHHQHRPSPGHRNRFGMRGEHDTRRMHQRRRGRFQQHHSFTTPFPASSTSFEPGMHGPSRLPDFFYEYIYNSAPRGQRRGHRGGQNDMWDYLTATTDFTPEDSFSWDEPMSTTPYSPSTSAMSGRRLPGARQPAANRKRRPMHRSKFTKQFTTPSSTTSAGYTEDFTADFTPSSTAGDGPEQGSTTPDIEQQTKTPVEFSREMTTGSTTAADNEQQMTTPVEFSQKMTTDFSEGNTAPMLSHSTGGTGNSGGTGSSGGAGSSGNTGSTASTSSTTSTTTEGTLPMNNETESTSSSSSSTTTAGTSTAHAGKSSTGTSTQGTSTHTMATAKHTQKRMRQVKGRISTTEKPIRQTVGMTEQQKVTDIHKSAQPAQDRQDMKVLPPKEPTGAF